MIQLIIALLQLWLKGVLRSLFAIADRYVYFILVDIFSFIIMQQSILITCQYLRAHVFCMLCDMCVVCMCSLHVTSQLPTGPKQC